MRVFHSELSANPSLYSFGYSVYGELEEGDSLDTCYDSGFLPFVGTKQQTGKLMYMGRGTRVSVQDFTERHYHGRVRRKAAPLGPITSELHPLSSFNITDEFIAFFLTYFKFRFGKDSMPEERLRAMLASGFITHIREYKASRKTVAYLLEVHGESCVHTWYHAYTHETEGSYLGLYLYIDLLNTLKKEGKKYLYLGITYGTWMAYKTHFQPLSFWNGSAWVEDVNSKQLKVLLKADSLRLLTFTDPWRESLTPFYTAPYAYTSFKAELRILTLAIAGLPRTSRLLILLVLGVFVCLLAQLL